MLVTAAALGSVPLVLAGSFATGAGAAAVALGRYAAVDTARPGTEARAVSGVLAAVAVGAVAGPNLLAPTVGLDRTRRGGGRTESTRSRIGLSAVAKHPVPVSTVTSVDSMRNGVPAGWQRGPDPGLLLTGAAAVFATLTTMHPAWGVPAAVTAFLAGRRPGPRGYR